MRFSENGYYIERYVKCDNCGVLIYDEGISVQGDDAEAKTFCSPWCREWHLERSRGVKSPQIDLAF